MLRESSPPPNFNVTGVTRHVSHVKKKSQQSGKVSQWTVGYQRGLPRVVLLILQYMQVMTSSKKVHKTLFLH